MKSVCNFGPCRHYGFGSPNHYAIIPIPLNSLTLTTPMIGFSTGQIARLNALNPVFRRQPPQEPCVPCNCRLLTPTVTCSR